MKSVLRKSLSIVMVLLVAVLSLSYVAKVHATDYSVTYTVTSTSAVSVTSGVAPNGSTATYSSTYNTKCQLTGGKSMTLTLSGYDGMTIKGLTLSMKSNKSAGAGSLSMMIGTSTVASIADAAFNDASWNGAFTTSYVPVTPTVTETEVGATKTIVITISASANSLYCESFTIDYTNPSSEPVVSISSQTTKGYIGGTIEFSHQELNIDNPQEYVWSSSNTNVGTISNGVLSLVGTGKTTVTLTVDGTLCTQGIEVSAFPTNENPIDVAEALVIAETTGNSSTSDAYTISGYMTTVDENNLTLKDLITNDTINVYKKTHGLSYNNTKVQLVGRIINLNNTTKQFFVTSLKQYFTVTFNPDNGNPTNSVEVLDGGKVDAPADPVKDGFTFVSWKKDSVDWNFTEDTVTSNITLTATWLSNSITNAELFEQLQTKSSIKFDYTTSVGVAIVNSSFIRTKNKDTSLPDGWSGTVGGSYSSPYYQAFKDDGNNVFTTLESVQTSVLVTVHYYINNQTASGNMSSKLKFTAYDEGDNVLNTYTSDELNLEANIGSSNATDISVRLTGNGIKKIEIMFVKDGGRNIAFSNVTISPLTYTIDKNQAGKNIASLRFYGLLSKDLVDGLESDGTNVTFGVIYGATANFNGDTVAEYCAKLSDGTVTVEQALAAGIKVRTMSLTGVNELGTEEVVQNPEYYQYGISINNFTDQNLLKQYSAATFVCIDGEYHIMVASSGSVASIAQANYNAVDTSNYQEHLGALKTLADLIQ